jgi:hypothetical protein
MTAKLRPLLAALLCTASLAGWQALTVHYTYGGNWTGLYCTGSRFYPPPLPLRSESIYIFQNSYGYDGQVYHYIAHDPFLQRGFASQMDAPRFRYRRILVPGLAFLLAFGQDRRIDTAHLAVLWIFIFLGAYWLGRLAVRHGHSAWFGLCFGLAPAVLVSIDRLTVDFALAACCAGFVLYEQERSPYKLYAVLAMAGLTREFGLILPAAWCVYLAGRRRFREAAVYSTAAAPTACWYLFVYRHTPPGDPAILSWAPFTGILGRIIHPFPYPFGGFTRILAGGLDLLALAGIVAALGWVVHRARARSWTPATVALYGLAIFTVAVSSQAVWSEVYAFGRGLTPLVLLAALDGMETGSLLPGAAMLAIDPRIGLQMGGQILHVVRGIIC